jgi:hypothetical protein
MRIWNVKRDIDQIKSAECNFSTAETLKTDHGLDDLKFFSYLRNFNRAYNKYMPNVTSITDDPLMISYEFTNHINILLNKQVSEQQKNKNLMLIDDFENELCIKCQNISIDKSSIEIESTYSSISPVSQNIKSIEDELYCFKKNDFDFIYLETPLSNMPINIIKQISVKKIILPPRLVFLDLYSIHKY